MKAALAERMDLRVKDEYDRPGPYTGANGAYLRSEKASMWAPAPTAWPHPSPSVQGWEAYVEYGAWKHWAAFLSVIARIHARLAGDVREVARLVSPEVYARIREAFASDDPVEAIIGYNDPKSGFTIGLAGLTPQESRAFELSLRLTEDGEPDLKEIASHMDRKKPPARRRSRSLFPGFQIMGASEAGEESIPLETAKQYVWRAYLKLAALFGAGAPGGTPLSRNSHTSLQSSTATPGTSASDTRTPKTSSRTPSFATSSAGTSSMSPSPC